MNAIRLSSSTARQRVPELEHKRVALRAFTALAEMCNGTARVEEWQDCADSVNIVEALATMGKLDAAITAPLVQLAIDGLKVAIKCPPGMMRMGASSTHALRELVTMHDDAIGRFSRGTMYEAWEMVQRRIYAADGGESTGLFVVNA